MDILLKIALLIALYTSFAVNQGVSASCDKSLSEPDDEDFEPIFKESMEKLEYKTGISALLPAEYNIDVTCNNVLTPCLVNPNGTAVWDARMLLYANHMRQSKGTNSYTYLDDCYCLSPLEFKTCMGKVRDEMMNELNSQFDKYVSDLIEKDSCESFEENCVTNA